MFLICSVWHYTGALVDIREQGEHKAQRGKMSELSVQTLVGAGGDEPGSGSFPDMTLLPCCLDSLRPLEFLRGPLRAGHLGLSRHPAHVGMDPVI